LAVDNPYRIPVGVICVRKRECNITEYLKHTIWEALSNKGCPICQVIKEREEKSFWWFINENYHEPSVLTEFMDNSFLCDYHAGILANGDHGSLSFTFQFLVQGDINKLNELSMVLTKDGISDKRQKAINPLSNYLLRNKKSKHSLLIDDLLKGYLSCRFCKLNENASKYVEELFAEIVRDDVGFKEHYLKSDGLCRRHFIEVLKLSEDKASDFLLDDMVHRLNKMKDSFDLYFHKLDYRFSGEPRGEEQNTWLRALKYYSSSKNNGNDS